MEIPASTFAPVIKFRFGADARDAEGAGATLTHVALTADGRAIEAVGIKFGLFGRTIYAPVERVVSASDGGVELSVTRGEIEKDGFQPEGLRLGGGASVTQTNKRIGKLTQMSFNADTRALRHVVVERGLGEVVISAGAVGQITSNSVALVTPRGGVSATLTPYRPDAELRDDAIKAIESYGRLRVDMEGVHITATDGVIWLRGFVSSELNRRLIGDLVSEIHGLGELHNELITDPELAARVSTALARDLRTAEEHIGVYPMLGHVRLRGVVHTAAAREAAVEIASATPGAGRVTNELRVDANANVLPVLAGVTNNEDAVPGGR
ncbi:MAG TPA: BON domain-containing protein [Ktedonobacterales bacterium]|nr:BON domain-containing protein [Ktedonobacterales bacterium]